MALTTTQKLFLEAIRASLHQEQLEPQGVSAEEWDQMFKLAQDHQILPLISDSVFNCEELQQAPGYYLDTIMTQAVHSVARQAFRTRRFSQVYRTLQENGLHPCIIKGLVVRSLYPNPDARMSVDEDLLVTQEEFPAIHQLMLKCGLSLKLINEEEIPSAHEVTYRSEDGMVYLEIHKSLFPPESKAYGELNRYFTDAFERRVQMQIELEGEDFCPETLHPTDHLLYLILHAFKHFLHSGFGIRQVCDICVFSEHLGDEIDWDYVLRCCTNERADLFAAAVFRIGTQYLGFDSAKARQSRGWLEMEANVDETHMLEDLLSAGVYGKATAGRIHSSTMTLDAVAAQRGGKGKGKSGSRRSFLRSVFLPLSAMQDKYSYLKKFPILLPAAWVQRVIGYLHETAGDSAGNNPVQTIRIGQQRVELLKEYGVID